MISRNLMWARWIRGVCIVQIHYVGDNVEKRILPTFESMTDEADKIEEEAWKRFGESAGPEADPSSGAEWAFEQGLDHYMNLSDLRQGMLSFSAAFCHHLFEQQLLYLHRKELLQRQ
jgi:hypothetical protein